MANTENIRRMTVKRLPRRLSTAKRNAKHNIISLSRVVKDLERKESVITNLSQSGDVDVVYRL